MVLEKVMVELGERSYSIFIGKGLIDHIGAMMSEIGCSGKLVVITNTVVGGLYRDRLIHSLKGSGFATLVIEIPDGEGYKTLDITSFIYDKLIEDKIERGSTIVALGGGVVGDIAGFVAATYLRGIHYVQVPTTLLAQVDSSVGGKTAVNHPHGKNLIGAFHQPKAVIIDVDLLKTLEKRDMIAGMAEVIKYGVIRDESFFHYLEENYAEILSMNDPLIHAIKRSCEIKASIVSEDEIETGVRAILNFGHTFGHAIETVTGYATYRHGEAVAIGMVLAGELSLSLGLCDEETCLRIRGMILKAGLPVETSSFSIERFIDAMELDKKVVDGMLRLILVEEIGKVTIKEMTRNDLRSKWRGLGIRGKKAEAGSRGSGGRTQEPEASSQKH